MKKKITFEVIVTDDGLEHTVTNEGEFNKIEVIGIAQYINRSIIESFLKPSEVLPDSQTEREEPPICHHCNGTGEGMTPDSTCTSCKGSGVEYPKDDKEWMIP